MRRGADVDMRLSITAAFVLSVLGAGCDRIRTSPKGSTEPAEPANSTLEPARDGGPPPPTPPPANNPLLGALFLQTPIMSDMEWPKDERHEKTGSVRLGYLRQGARVPVLPEAHPKTNCREGWYELIQGGFVCGKYGSLDLTHPRIKFAPHQPELINGNLPYDYGYNTQNGTPLYRSIPGREERTKLEPWLAPRRTKRVREEDVGNGPDDLDAGSGTRGGDPLASSDDAGLPWYLREYDGGKPMVTLDDLRGEGPVSRRMVKGFFLALDKEFTVNGTKWWKTTGSLIAPFNRVFVYKNASEFRGTWFGTSDAAAPTEPGDAGTSANPSLCRPGSRAQVAVVISARGKKYQAGPNRKAFTALEGVPRHTVVRLTGESAVALGQSYDETEEGWWTRSVEVTKTRPGDPPKDLGPGEKWVDVNLTTQTLVAFEGERPVFATAVSTGKRDDQDKERDHRTPPGTFRIREKHVAATMDGDVASDGPYSIEDVPWIMYFNASYALHGAFWHNNFGRMQSHGCVNMAPADAKALFNWSEPKLPDGWHGAMATVDKPGTIVVVHE